MVVTHLDCEGDAEKVIEIAEKTGSKLILVMRDCNTKGASEILPAMDKAELDDLIKM